MKATLKENQKIKCISYNDFSIQIEEDIFFPSYMLLYLQFDKLPPQIENNKICFYNICEIDLWRKKVFRTSCKDNCLQFKHTFICWNKIHFSLIEISLDSDAVERVNTQRYSSVQDGVSIYITDILKKVSLN